MKKKKILVVDDDVDFADSLADLLRFEKYDVTAVYSGMDAIAEHKINTFDITLMDIKMPQMNGYETLVELKKLDKDKRVILMTGFSAPELIDQAKTSGADHVMHKPIDVTTVLSLLR